MTTHWIFLSATVPVVAAMISWLASVSEPRRRRVRIRIEDCPPRRR